MMTTEDNPLMRHGDSAAESLVKLHSAAMQQGKVFYFKGCPQDDDEVLTQMLRLKARVVYFLREQALDQRICSINDFHNAKGGWRVNEAGERVDMSRRFERGGQVPTKVFFNTTMLLRQVKGYLEDAYKPLAQLKSLGFAGVKLVTSENLSAFEYSVPGGLERSVQAWSDFFASMGLVANRHIIRSHMRRNGFRSRTMEPHEEMIANAAEVAAVLRAEDKRLRRLYRSSPADFFDEEH
eukprot:TRINITY_DN16246_c0_g1_i1.p1 TRINITY_DN16246_c0_g1~~TRINITY_DN16246_c0_g1_i1.p1  ORF type:complete len:238 (-),score=46.08 TRINITY_DN16246_c0_g1_i1:175-888(-)